MTSTDGLPPLWERGCCHVEADLATWHADDRAEVFTLGPDVDRLTAQLDVARPRVHKCYLITLQLV